MCGGPSLTITMADGLMGKLFEAPEADRAWPCSCAPQKGALQGSASLRERMAAAALGAQAVDEAANNAELDRYLAAQDASACASGWVPLCLAGCLSLSLSGRAGCL